jgi:hypothetical protein
MTRLAIALALTVAVFTLPAAASQRVGVVPAEQRIMSYGTALPGCADTAVLGEVTARFGSRETGFWNSTLAIRGYDKVRQTALRPWGIDFVPRRFCTARAHLSDGKARQVNYFVRETISLIGNSWEVIWCVQGLDRGRTYAPACEQATYWN